uniref:Membrane-spanning 4-domains subfamily A member 6D-like n=1 Tax=Jaculus jaculus TaxID=51337 RepID=A0A8C5KS07_JACJA
MISQVMTNETVTVITTNGVSFAQTDKPQPIYKIQDGLKKHLKSEIKVIAAIQILCGIMLLFLGIILASAPTASHFTPVFASLLKSAYPFVGALCFVLSGSLSVITEKKSTKPLVHSSLAVSILSVLSTVVGISILSFNLAALGPATKECELNKELKTTPYSYYDYLDLPKRECHSAKITLTGALSVMLICTVLELSLAVLTALLWWKQAHSDFPGSVIFLSRDSRNKPSISSKSLCNHEYEELATP